MIVLLLISLQVFWSSGLISDLTSSLTSDLISSLIVSLAVSFIARLTECPSIEYVGRICWSLRILSKNNGKLLHFSVAHGAHMEQAHGAHRASPQHLVTWRTAGLFGRVALPGRIAGLFGMKCTAGSYCEIPLPSFSSRTWRTWRRTLRRTLFAGLWKMRQTLLRKHTNSRWPFYRANINSSRAGFAKMQDINGFY